MSKMIRNTLMGLMLVAVLAACNMNAPPATPTAESLVTLSPTEVNASVTPSATLAQTQTATLPTTPRVTVAVVTVPAEEDIAQVPTLAPSPTETPGPYRHIIAEGETLGYIIQLQPWAYPFDPAVIDAVVALNDNMLSADFLPPVGSELLIPRRTATPIPQGIDLTLTSDASIGFGERVGGVVLPQGSMPGCHNVAEGETLVGIADIYGTTLEVISQLNQNLNWFGCNFTEYSGGPNCNPIIREDQCIMVPLPTPVPTQTATPSGNETATPTPTFVPARLVFPPDGAIASAGVFALQWTSVGVLQEGNAYLVEIHDTTSDVRWSEVTTSTSLTLPDALIPSDGQTHQVRWRVSVARRLEDGTVAYSGGVGEWRTFQWQSR
jgi:hypothetical protein